jgi:hypothetical protein
MLLVVVLCLSEVASQTTTASFDFVRSGEGIEQLWHRFKHRFERNYNSDEDIIRYHKCKIGLYLVLLA